MNKFGMHKTLKLKQSKMKCLLLVSVNNRIAMLHPKQKYMNNADTILQYVSIRKHTKLKNHMIKGNNKSLCISYYI